MRSSPTREGIVLIVLSLLILATAGALMAIFGPDKVIPGRGPLIVWVAIGSAGAIAVGAYGVARLIHARKRWTEPSPVLCCSRGVSTQATMGAKG